MSKEAIEHYEAALKEAFPSGATGNVFHHWNEARKALAEQPAQQQEPVAWVLEWTFNGEERGRRLYDDETHCVFDAENDGGVCRPLVYGDTYPPAQQQEPKLPEFYARFEDGLVSVYQRREDATPLLLLRENLPDEQPAQQQEPVAAPEPRGLIDIGRIFRGEDK